MKRKYILIHDRKQYTDVVINYCKHIITTYTPKTY